jgi:hypothetical protein
MAAVAGAEGEAGDVPDGQQRRRPHAPRRDVPGEGVEVHLLLRLHVADRFLVLRAAQHGELALVDALGAVLAGVVHADHLLEVAARGLGHRLGSLRAPAQARPASISHR